jgi:hypothetical protein
MHVDQMPGTYIALIHDPDFDPLSVIYPFDMKAPIAAWYGPGTSPAHGFNPASPDAGWQYAPKLAFPRNHYAIHDLKRVLGKNKAVLDAQSPSNPVARRTAAVFPAHGTLDSRMPVNHAREMRNALEDAGPRANT